MAMLSQDKPALLSRLVMIIRNYTRDLPHAPCHPEPVLSGRERDLTLPPHSHERPDTTAARSTLKFCHSERRGSFAARMILTVEEPAFQRAAPLVACRRTLLYSARLKPCPSHSCSCRHDDRLQPCFQAVLFPFLLLPTPTTSSGPSFQSRALPVLALADNREPTTDGFHPTTDNYC